jgi:sulfite reductase beta subunit-like hemoprotein
MMYRNNELYREAALSRISAFRDQIERRLAGEITEEAFRPMRLANGVHLREHAYMLRVPVPSGVLSSPHLRMLAHVARIYDRGYARFTADRNVEFHWPALSDIPSALTDLVSVGLYAAGTESGFIRDGGGSQPEDAASGDPDHATLRIPLDGAPDLSDDQMETLADLAETYGVGELHVGDGREIALPHVARADFYAVHDRLAAIGLGGRRPFGPTPFTERRDAREIEAA